MYFGEDTPKGYEYPVPETQAGASVTESEAKPIPRASLEKLAASARAEREKSELVAAR